ncbi:MAG: Rieske (2Fe-2S) protein [Pseudomonadota bacterium]
MEPQDRASRTDWQYVCGLDELTLGVPNLVQVGRDFYFVASESRSVRLFEAICPHHASSLSFARIEGCEVECPLHGWRFDIVSGECIRGGRDLTERTVKVEDGSIFAQLG